MNNKKRNRGRPAQGRIEELVNGKFRARICLNKLRHDKTFDTKADAAKWLIDMEVKQALGNMPRHLKAKAITLGQGMDDMLADIHPGRYYDDTAKKIRYLKKIEEALCNTPLADIDRDMIKAFVARRKAGGAKAATVNRDLVIMRGVFNLAATEWGCEGLANPVSKITAGEETKRERRPTELEWEALRKAAAAYGVTGKSKVPIMKAIEFTAGTGLRIAELGTLTWGDVKWADNSIWVTGKGKKRRQVPLFPSSIEILRSMGGGRPGDLVFGTTDSIRNAWEAVRALAAVECPSVFPGNEDNLRWHDLRHEGVSRYYERTDLADGAIGAITGLDDPRSLYRYRNIRNKDLAPRLAEGERRHDERLKLAADLNPYKPAAVEPDETLNQKAAWKTASACKQLMQSLVNSLPIIQIAQMYDVSDVAVHKACKRLGVEKKAVGHWARERALQDAA